MATEEIDPRVIAWRTGDNSKRLGKLEDWRTTIDTERATFGQKLDGVTEDVKDVHVEIRSLRKALIGFALTIAGSAVLFAFSIMAATGKL